MSDSEDYSDVSSDDYQSPVKKTTKKPTTTKSKKPAASKPKKPAAASKKKSASKSKESDEEMDDFISDGDSDEDDSPPRSSKSNSKDKEENIFENIAASVKSGKKTVEEIYQKKELLDQILLRPDTYIGSVEKQEEELYVWDEEGGKMEKRKISFVPGIYKIFDEILVNAADNKQREGKMKFIKVDIDAKVGKISISNDGAGIPVQVHKEHKIYVPELIFGNLLTSSHYDDSEQRLTGGRNGFGAKLANIFSTKFIVECADSTNKKLFKQTFTKNMKQKEEPQITSYSKSSNYTTITFYPELTRFGMDSFDDDLMSLLKKRVYDIAGCNSGLKVELNGKDISFKSFEKYISLYINNDDESNPVKVLYERVNERWEIAVALSVEQQFNQVSFVNSICTTKGGTHVTHAMSKVITAIQEKIKKTNKSADIKPHMVKNYLFVFVNSLIVNPQFDSQTKEALTTKVSNFGSKCEPSDAFIKKTLDAKTGIIKAITEYVKFREQTNIMKKMSGKKSGRPYHPKLDDANLAGSKSSQDCTLILTEGDSAKTIATAGISVVGRDHYGAFPLKGKIENVSEIKSSKLVQNEEITSIVEILGLQYEKEYESVESLRYGHLMIMTDQDHDGSHIKGLLINLIKHFWPSLLKIPGFLVEFITPIVKCFKKGQKTLSFYTIPEFLRWKEENQGKGWDIKYYKGLGTSKPEEGKEYFAAIDKHKIDFEWDDEAEENIDLVFNKKRADDRKKWMSEHVEGTYLEQYGTQTLTYSDFINKELVLFSIADCERSLPNLMDGLKTSLRKILYSCFKRNLKKEIKVAQLMGYVSEQSAYHHGEQSLNKAIVGMAQDYVGSNNINLLYPSGSFGSRYSGGDDCSSARYINTRLQDIARTIFHPDDDHVLNYCVDDGKKVEPKFYVPIIPMLLVNGNIGIGTGWSSKILSYNPRDLIQNIKLHLDEKPMLPLKPFTRGFTGEITVDSKGSFQFHGVWKKLGEYQFEILELPVNTWTQPYKEFLEELMNPGTKAKRQADKDKLKGKKPSKTTSTAAAAKKKKKEAEDEEMDPVITKYLNYSSESLVHFIITTRDPIDQIDIPKVFKLSSKSSETNMVVFDDNGKITKFDTTQEIFENFLKVRMHYYQLRVDFLCDKLADEHKRLSNKARFILAVVNKEIIINNVKKSEIMKKLKEMKFDKMSKSTEKSAKKKFKEKIKKGFNEEDAAESDEERGENDDEEDQPKDDDEKGYDYLLSLPIWSLTLERVKKIQEERDKKEKEWKDLKSTPLKKIYMKDLEALEIELDKQDEYDEYQKSRTNELKSKSKGKKLPRAKKISSSAARSTKSKATITKPTLLKPTTKSITSTTKSPETSVTTKTTLGKRKKDESEPESISDSDSDSDSDVEISLPPPKARSTVATTKPAASTSASNGKIDSYFTKVTPTTTSTTATTKKSEETISLDSDSDEESKLAAKKTKVTTSSSVVAKPVQTVTKKPTAKTAAKSTTTTTKKVLSKKTEDDSFIDSEDDKPSTVKATAATTNLALPSLRKRAPVITTTFFDSDDDDLFDSEENSD